MASLPWTRRSRVYVLLRRLAHRYDLLYLKIIRFVVLLLAWGRLDRFIVLLLVWSRLDRLHRRGRRDGCGRLRANRLNHRRLGSNRLDHGRLRPNGLYRLDRLDRRSRRDGRGRLRANRLDHGRLGPAGSIRRWRFWPTGRLIRLDRISRRQWRAVSWRIIPGSLPTFAPGISLPTLALSSVRDTIVLVMAVIAVIAIIPVILTTTTLMRGLPDIAHVDRPHPPAEPAHTPQIHPSPIGADLDFVIRPNLDPIFVQGQKRRLSRFEHPEIADSLPPVSPYRHPDFVSPVVDDPNHAAWPNA